MATSTNSLLCSTQSATHRQLSAGRTRARGSQSRCKRRLTAPSHVSADSMNFRITAQATTIARRGDPQRTCGVDLQHTQNEMTRDHHRHGELLTRISCAVHPRSSLKGLQMCIPPLICVTVLILGINDVTLALFVFSRLRLRLAADLGVPVRCLCRRGERGARPVPVLKTQMQVGAYSRACVVPHGSLCLHRPGHPHPCLS